MNIANIDQTTDQELMAIEIFRTIKSKADQEKVILRLSGYVDGLIEIEQEQKKEYCHYNKIINFPNG